MRRFLYSLAVPIFLSAFCAGVAVACTFSQDEVEVRPFLASAKPSKIVFQGKVHKIEYLGKNAKGNPTQKITFKVSRWWRGIQREFVTVHGETGVMAQFDCEGAYDFWVKPGSEWIILGTESDGLVNALPSLSISTAHKGAYDDVLNSLKNVKWIALARDRFGWHGHPI